VGTRVSSSSPKPHCVVSSALTRTINFCMLPTRRVCAFCMFPATDSDYSHISKQH
jgi:hypothetical protein